MSSLYDSLLESVRLSIALPALMRVERVRVNKELGGYNADGELLSIASDGELTNSGARLQNVPICTVAASSSGAGIFAAVMPEQIAVVQYIQGLRAHPVITGWYTERLTPAADDQAAISVHAGAGKLRMANSVASLYRILDNVLGVLQKLTTQGGPSNQTINPADATLLSLEKQKLATLLEE